MAPKTESKTATVEEDIELEEEPDVGDARKYFKEGQRFVTPINGDSTRGFYESLLLEKPHSHLAIRYCVENGLMSGEKHEKLLKQYYELRASGVYSVNKQAIQRMAMWLGEATSSPKKELSSRPAAVKRERSSSPEESQRKKHKKDKKEKKHKKDKKKKHKSSSDSD